MSFYSKSKDEVLKQLNSSKDGLSTEEAGKRLEQNGENKLAEGKKVSLMMRFLSHQTKGCPYYNHYDEYGVVRKQN